MDAVAVGPRERSRRSRALRRRLGEQIVELREEAHVSQAALAGCARIDPAHLLRIERGTTNASLEVLTAIAACLGSDLSLRMFPTSGPRLHDRFQAPMVEALLRSLGPDWSARPEVAVPSARGVIDLVLRRSADRLVIACECHSEIRRLDLALRRLSEKANGLHLQLDDEPEVSRLLLLRSTVATRALARAYESTFAAAFPARCERAVAALRGVTPWPGPAIVWARVEGGKAEILGTPPRGVRVGR